MIEYQKYMEISRELEKHHAVFYTLWSVGKPFLVSACDSAAIVFDDYGKAVNFIFNPDFWENSTNYELAFTISHECLHVIFNHGFRCLDCDNLPMANIAMDLVVNHTLVRNFGFDRDQIRGAAGLCWVDTVFPNRQVPDDQTFEFYYNLLKEYKGDGGASDQDGDGSLGGGSGSGGQSADSGEGGGGLPETLDDHSGFGRDAHDFQDVCSALAEQLSPEDKESLRDTIEAHFQYQDPKQTNESTHSRGDGPGNVWSFAQVGDVSKKKKWETVIKKWAMKFIKQEMKDVEQWARRNRRFSCIGQDLMLPTEVEIEDREEEDDKIQVWFFQDTSGSCSGFRDRFFKAALSLPSEKFDVKMYCFDTKVYETTLESKKLYGFGGTSFHIIENYVQRVIKENDEPYPKAIFVITDGYGTRVNPEFPEKWHWFLSTNADYCIPKECNIHKLSEFE